MTPQVHWHVKSLIERGTHAEIIQRPKTYATEILADTAASAFERRRKDGSYGPASWSIQCGH